METTIKATHNSGTGESSQNLLRMLAVPFSRCQSKTIATQYSEGVRLFDIRVDDENRICHGLWKSGRTLMDVLNDICVLDICCEPVHFIITYEGKLTEREKRKFKWRVMDEFRNRPSWMIVDSINVKLPTWETIRQGKDPIVYKQTYTKIQGWKVLLPIPYLWHLIEKFDTSEGVCMVDFL